MAKQQVYLGIGSNMQNPIMQVEKAITAIAQLPQIDMLKKSSLYQTKPQGYLKQADFINAVIKIATSLLPIELLNMLQQIEKSFGRVRDEIRFGPRVIDLDILLYADVKLVTKELVIPHPRMVERLFVLIPLLEIAPEFNSKYKLPKMLEPKMCERLISVGEYVC